MTTRWILPLMLAVSVAPARAELYRGFPTGVANAPAPPVIGVRREPALYIVPHTRIYKVNDPSLHLDGDMFLFGGSWYIYTRRFWYSAVTLRGPYRVTDARNVPQEILFVPAQYWAHHPSQIAAAAAYQPAATIEAVRDTPRAAGRGRGVAPAKSVAATRPKDSKAATKTGSAPDRKAGAHADAKQRGAPEPTDSRRAAKKASAKTKAGNEARTRGDAETKVHTAAKTGARADAKVRSAAATKRHADAKSPTAAAKKSHAAPNTRTAAITKPRADAKAHTAAKAKPPHSMTKRPFTTPSGATTR